MFQWCYNDFWVVLVKVLTTNCTLIFPLLTSSSSPTKVQKSVLYLKQSIFFFFKQEIKEQDEIASPTSLSIFSEGLIQSAFKSVRTFSLASMSAGAHPYSIAN